ncbi:MAG: GAF domain-containing protein [Vicinamibacterales bacterium]
MTAGRRRAVSLTIWGLLAALGALQVAAWSMGYAPRRPLGLAQVIAGWVVMLLLASLSTRLIGQLAEQLSATEHAHRATKSEVEQLQMHNAMLDILARSVDVPLAFQSLAQRIARLVPCDRVGLALLTEAGDEFQTYTARVNEDERRLRPRPEVVFKADRTAIGTAVRTREPLIINDVEENAPDYLDINVIHSSGFGSALLIPLVSKERGVGTLNLVSRRKHAFTQAHVDALLPVTEIFAVAYVAQQLQIAVTRHRTVEAMSDLTLNVATEINSALQTIIGHCDLLERGYPDPSLQRDLATVVRQAQRISALLDKMRSASAAQVANLPRTS